MSIIKNNSTIDGDLTISGNISANNLSIINWNNAYTIVNTNSAI